MSAATQDAPCQCAVCGMCSYSVFPVVDGKRRCRICESKHRHPYWPRGKCNGQRIVGISIQFKLDLSRWRWKPVLVREVGGFHWLCWYLWIQLNFAD